MDSDINMTEELFVEDPEISVSISDKEAQGMRKAVLSAKDAPSALDTLNEELVTKYTRSGRHREVLDIIGELLHRMDLQSIASYLYMREGFVHESRLDFGSAMISYVFGVVDYLTMEEPDKDLGYWLYNNGSFFHNHQKFFSQIPPFSL